jgi:hypothetical protein
VQRPAGGANQKVLYDAKRHAHTAQGLAVSTIWGDLLWVNGGWPGSCHEHELLGLARLEGPLDEVQVASLLDRGVSGHGQDARALACPVGDRRTIGRLSDGQRAYNRLQVGLRALSSSRSPTWQGAVASAVSQPGQADCRHENPPPWSRSYRSVCLRRLLLPT